MGVIGNSTRAVDFILGSPAEEKSPSTATRIFLSADRGRRFLVLSIHLIKRGETHVRRCLRCKTAGAKNLMITAIQGRFRFIAWAVTYVCFRPAPVLNTTTRSADFRPVAVRCLYAAVAAALPENPFPTLGNLHKKFSDRPFQ